MHGLEREGYIVIASVSSPDAIDELEAHGHGYVRALVLDPKEVRFRASIAQGLYIHEVKACDDPDLPAIAPSYVLSPLPTAHVRRSVPAIGVCGSASVFRGIAPHAPISAGISIAATV